MKMFREVCFNRTEQFSDIKFSGSNSGSWAKTPRPNLRVPRGTQQTVFNIQLMNRYMMAIVSCHGSWPMPHCQGMCSSELRRSLEIGVRFRMEVHRRQQHVVLMENPQSTHACEHFSSFGQNIPGLKRHDSSIIWFQQIIRNQLHEKWSQDFMC